MADTQRTIQRVKASDAARHFAGMEHLDPTERCADDDIEMMCTHGECFAVESADGRAVFVIERGPRAVFVTAAAGAGGVDLTAEIDAALRIVAPGPAIFQTKRRGLVRRTQSLGYSIVGYTLRRDA